MDGVLVDSFECWWQVLRDLQIAEGKEPLTRERFLETWGQDVEADRRSYFPEFTTAELTARYDAAFPHYAHLIQAEPGAVATLTALRKGGKRLGVATNSPTPVARTLLDRTKLTPYFDCIACADLVPEGKPAPDLLHYLARELGVGAPEIAYIGDSEFDAVAARAADVYFIGYRREGSVRIEGLSELVPV
jgi:HAD superfamily hydrolase (TIGR01549 family)